MRRTRCPIAARADLPPALKSSVTVLLLLFPPWALAQSAVQPTPAPAIAAASDQITVTANRSATPLGNTAKTVYTLSPAQLQNYPAITLDDALRQQPGFELFRRAPSRVANPTSEGISLRGLGSTAASRTLVLLDGAPLNDPFGGYIHWSELPAPALSAVTLVTGGGSDLYGSSALGGVIDILTTPPAPSTFTLSARGGSQATSDLATLATRTFHPNTGQGIATLFAAESLRTAGYRPLAPSLQGAVDTPANVLSQSWRTELGRRTFPTHRLFLTGNLLNDSRNNGTPLQTNATRLWRYLAAYETPAAAHIPVRARLFGSAEGYRQSFSAITSTRAAENLTRLQRVHTQELGASMDATLPLRRVALVFGADARDLRATDNETPITAGRPNGLQNTTARQRFLGAFAELLAARGPWSAAASLRLDHATNLDIVQRTATTVTPIPNRAELIASPRLGLLRTLGPHAALHASVFRAFRTPTFNELYRTGQVGQEITQANPALLSERATGYEVGTQLTSTPASLQATWFYTQVNRPVSAVLISSTPTTITNQRQNLGQIRSQGVELLATFHPVGLMTATLGYQYADSTVTKFSAQPLYVGNQIPQVPRHAATAQLRAPIPHLADFTLAARTASRSFDDAANLYPLARYFQLDASVARAITPNLSADLLIQNLTNRRPEVSRTPLLTLGSPIFVQAGLRYTFPHRIP